MGVHVEAFRRRIAKFTAAKMALVLAVLGLFVLNTAGAISAVPLVLTVVGAIVVVIVLAALADPFFDALGSLIENFTVVQLGTSDAANIGEVIISTLAILVAVGGAFLLVGFALRAFKTKGV